MENGSIKIVQRGDVYVMTMLKGENRFTNEFLDHLNEGFDFLEKYAILIISHALDSMRRPFSHLFEGFQVSKLTLTAANVKFRF